MPRSKKDSPKWKVAPSGANKKSLPRHPESPDSHNPVWAFRYVDQGSAWDLADCGSDLVKIIRYLGEWEKLTWHQIKLEAKKKNHTLEVANDLTKKARDRLAETGRDPESVLALHIENRKVLYGIREGPAYYILWYDPDHRDSEDCVCRSRKKHT